MGLTRKKSEINAEHKGRTVGGQQNKPDINAERKGRTVGGQQKNQSLKGAFLAAAETAPFFVLSSHIFLYLVNRFLLFSIDLLYILW